MKFTFGRVMSQESGQVSGEKLFEFVSANSVRFVSELSSLVAIPSVSMRPDEHLAECRDWLERELRARSFEVMTLTNHAPGSVPALLASLVEDEAAPTVLIYGHYDVQPADDLGWNSHPFQAVVNKGRLFARG